MFTELDSEMIKSMPVDKVLPMFTLLVNLMFICFEFRFPPLLDRPFSSQQWYNRNNSGP